MIEVTPAVVWQIINFILLIFLMNMVMYKPLRKILNERKEKVEGLEGAVESSQQEVVDIEGVFNTKMSEARMKGAQEKDAFEQAGLTEERRVIDEINEKAQAELEAVRAQIAKEAEEAKGKLKAEAEGFSVAIAEKLLGRAVS